MSQADSIKWDAKTVRQTFLDYFTNNQNHAFVKSSPVVPHEDPTLLFTNAGMNQFKPIFLGQVDPTSPLSKLTRAANSQKCIRAGGKHNDLEDVGRDTYHHTFFEMLGNWSFGDYFKKEAIPWAFHLLTQVYGLDKSRMYATYFEGNGQDLQPDLEAKELWLSLLPENQVLPGNMKDNFWEMGETGPCGPCTEIHYDRIGNRNAAHLVNRDDPNVVEIWNIVFIQYNRQQDSSLVLLPNKHVDTGMGFERLVSILQDKPSNYDTDVFLPLFQAIQTKANVRPYTGKLGLEDTDGVDMAYRVIADHIRTLSFAIADGAVPSNEGRGYVLRRILRRAVRYAKQFFNSSPGFFTQLVDPLAEFMEDTFPELTEKKDFIKEVILDEELSFGKTLAKGIETFTKYADVLASENSNILDGKKAFFLYDTMGFPLDLTQIMAQERGLIVDVPGYQAAMEEARNISKLDRASRAAGGKPIVLEAQETDHLKQLGIQATNDAAKYVWNQPQSAKIKAIFSPDEGFLQLTPGSDSSSHVALILDSTSYYPENGGQVADIGTISSKSGDTVFVVQDCQVFGGYVLHIGYIEKGSPLALESDVVCNVDYNRRSFIAPNHTMTHVMNYALREVIGPNSDQKGSLVDENKLRFDFTSSKGLTVEQIAKVEEIVQSQIKKALKVYAQVVPLDAAKSISSLRAVFGEVYPDPVRVISVGEPVDNLIKDPTNAAWNGVSIEFCGGTHLSNTEQAEAFLITEEVSIAKGIRRITAVTRNAAQDAAHLADHLEKQINELDLCEDESLQSKLNQCMLNVGQATIGYVRKYQLRKKLDILSEKAKKMYKDQSAKKAEAALNAGTTLADNAAKEGRRFLVLNLDLGGDTKSALKIMTAMKEKFSSGGILLLYVDSVKNKVAALAHVPEDQVKLGLSANAWVSSAMSSINGKGGGKDTQAQGQGQGAQSEALKVLEESVQFAKKILG